MVYTLLLLLTASWGIATELAQPCSLRKAPPVFTAELQQ